MDEIEGSGVVIAPKLSSKDSRLRSLKGTSAERGRVRASSLAQEVLGIQHSSESLPSTCCAYWLNTGHSINFRYRTCCQHPLHSYRRDIFEGILLMRPSEESFHYNI
ncbi:MAG: hypothetical protein EWM73_02195 [Nitrospira sp.]|nr:MAG: hypothetical protein EWM73_02195 [Nitrospira sp.]